jgi:hypothetical protein
VFALFTVRSASLLQLTPCIMPMVSPTPHPPYTLTQGFNDVSMHGSPQVPTPHIDNVAQTGFALMNYHAQPVCSPSRASILSGRHVTHTGIYMPFAQVRAGGCLLACMTRATLHDTRDSASLILVVVAAQLVDWTCRV